MLTAVPSAGYQFQTWSGDVDANAANDLSISIVMDSARTITAYFVVSGSIHTSDERKLTAVSAPEHGGSITYDPPLYAAGTYPDGTVVVLTAVPSAGYQFEKWSGDIDANAAKNISISIALDRARTITADFVAFGGLYPITVNVSPTLGGSVTVKTPSQSFTTNGESVSVQCASGTIVNITAVAAEGYRFAGWTGGTSGSQGNMSFAVAGSETITANFAKPSSLLWLWVIAGIVAVLLTVLLIYKFKSGRAKKMVYLQ